MLQIVASISDDSRGVIYANRAFNYAPKEQLWYKVPFMMIIIYDCQIFIVQATGCIIIKRVSWFKSSLLLRIQSDSFTNINS